MIKADVKFVESYIYYVTFQLFGTNLRVLNNKKNTNIKEKSSLKSGAANLVSSKTGSSWIHEFLDELLNEFEKDVPFFLSFFFFFWTIVAYFSNVEINLLSNFYIYYALYIYY